MLAGLFRRFNHLSGIRNVKFLKSKFSPTCVVLSCLSPQCVCYFYLDEVKHRERKASRERKALKTLQEDPNINLKRQKKQKSYLKDSTDFINFIEENESTRERYSYFNGLHTPIQKYTSTGGDRNSKRSIRILL